MRKKEREKEREINKKGKERKRIGKRGIKNLKERNIQSGI